MISLKSGMQEIASMENQEWEQFKSEIKRQLLILPKSPKKLVHLDIAKATTHYNTQGKVIENTLIEVNNKLLEKRDSFIERQVLAVTMAHFLWCYEGNYTLCIDEICSLLTINGHDLFDVFRREYAVTFEDVTNVDTSTKLKFLEAHNLKILDRKEDRKLRNKLAHHDFKLDDEGLEIDGSKVNILQRSTDLLNFCAKIWDILTECYNEVVDEWKRNGSTRTVQ